MENKENSRKFKIFQFIIREYFIKIFSKEKYTLVEIDFLDALLNYVDRIIINQKSVFLAQYL